MQAINFKVVYSANGNVTLTKTVINAIAAIGIQRNVFSSEDVQFVINSKVYSDEQVTIKQVTAVLIEITKCCKRGERYHGLKNVVALQYGFYEYC